jgi:hypothetical protein
MKRSDIRWRRLCALAPDEAITLRNDARTINLKALFVLVTRMNIPVG